MKILLLTILSLFLISCATTDHGANWAVADFNKYNVSYHDFPTQMLEIGLSKSVVISAFGNGYEKIEMGEGYEIIAYQKWKAVVGPDFVEKTIYLKFESDKLSHFKISNDTVVVRPLTW